MNTPICDFLESYENAGRLRLHMPGHNGETPHDITEVDGADSLFDCDGGDGIIAQSEKNCAELFGTAKTCYSAGGSTLAIQTALAVLKSHGVKTVAASRYAHKSLVSAAALLRLNIKWLYPSEYLTADIPVDEQSLGGADALFVTNVDYYGGTWCKKNPGIPVVCDNAHGSYLKFVDKSQFGTEYLHPTEFGFPVIAAESAHKTLPVLTGGAYLHFTENTDYLRAKELMAMFGSSSPSYLIMESLDRWNETISANPGLVNRACGFVAELKAALEKAYIPMRKSDYLRIVIDAAEYGYRGAEYAAALRGEGVECEMADENYVVLLFSAVTTYEECERTRNAVLFIRRKAPLAKAEYPAIKPQVVLPVYDAMFRPQRVYQIDKVVGAVCGNIHAPCPPGVPLIMPGERLDKDTAQTLKMYGINEISVIVK